MPELPAGVKKDENLELPEVPEDQIKGKIDYLLGS